MKIKIHIISTILILGVFTNPMLFASPSEEDREKEKTSLTDQALAEIFELMTGPIVIWGIEEYKTQIDELKTRGVILETNSTSSFFRTDKDTNALKAEFIGGRKMELIFESSSKLVIYRAMYENPWEREWLNSEMAIAMFSNREFAEMSVQEELKMMIEHHDMARKNKPVRFPPYEKLNPIPEKMRSLAVPPGMEIVEVWQTNNGMALLIGCIKKTDCGAYMTFYLSRLSNKHFFE